MLLVTNDGSSAYCNSFLLMYDAFNAMAPIEPFPAPNRRIYFSIHATAEDYEMLVNYLEEMPLQPVGIINFTFNSCILFQVLYACLLKKYFGDHVFCISYIMNQFGYEAGQFSHTFIKSVLPSLNALYTFKE